MSKRPHVRSWSDGRYQRVYLSDGTSWPHPSNQADGHAGVEMAQAYWNLLTHPWGTEVSVRKLRELRRTLAERTKRGGK